LAVPIGLAFDGTVVPVAAGICVASAFGFALMLWMKRLEERF
jgi:DHA1 family bicyclomycin/chloramphenicol resistance-like MFS transporter